MPSDELLPPRVELPQAIRMTDSGLAWDDSRQICDSGDKGMEEALEKRLEKWIEAACSQSPEHQRTGKSWVEFNRIYKHPKWLCKRDKLNRDYYEDGLYAMWWKYFWKYLCTEGDNHGKRVPSFFDTRKYAVPRMLKRLGGELTDLGKKRIPIQTGDPDDYFAEIPAPSFASDDVYNRILQYIASDPQEELQALVVGRQPLGRMRLYLMLRIRYYDESIIAIVERMNICLIMQDKHPDESMTTIVQRMDNIYRELRAKYPKESMAEILKKLNEFEEIENVSVRIPYSTIKDKRWKTKAQEWERRLAEQAMSDNLNVQNLI